MIPAFASLLLLTPLQPGSIPHLAKGELAVVSEGGGHAGYVGRLVVRTDGAVLYSASERGAKARLAGWTLTKGELGAFRMLVANADFPTLHRGTRAEYPPSAVDAIDRGLAVRQGGAVRGWSNVVWKQPEPEPALFTRLREFVARSRERL